MKTITIVSGKGGTGKTSIVSSLAALISPVMIADCDVDAPDLHLVLHPEIKKRNPFAGSKTAFIDPERCIQCGECEALCRFDAISQQPAPGTADLQFTVDPIACEGCSVCQWFCPTKAIDMVDRQNGEWYVSETEYGPMLHAQLGIAAENSGRLVTLVRNFAKGVAESRNLEYTIVDGPPGIGCSAIASLTGVDFALMVTEPTASGFHDLERLAELIDHFEISSGICINKWDINPEVSKAIERWGIEKGYPVLGKIRFDPAIVQAQVAGLPVVRFSKNGVVSEIEQLWYSIRTLLSESVHQDSPVKS